MDDGYIKTIMKKLEQQLKLKKRVLEIILVETKKTKMLNFICIIQRI